MSTLRSMGVGSTSGSLAKAEKSSTKRRKLAISSRRISVAVSSSRR